MDVVGLIEAKNSSERTNPDAPAKYFDLGSGKRETTKGWLREGLVATKRDPQQTCELLKSRGLG